MNARAYYNEIDPFSADWLESLVAAGLVPAGDVDRRSIEDVTPADLAGYTQCHFFGGIGGWPLALRLAGVPDDRPLWTGSCPCQPFSAAGKRKAKNDDRHLWPVWFDLIKRCKPPVVYGEQVASTEVVGTQLEAAFIIAVQRGDYAKANGIANRLVKTRGFHFHRRWADGVRADLEGEGYAFWFPVLGSHSIGAPHIRQRLYWMADADGERRNRQHALLREETGGRNAPELPEIAGRCTDGRLASQGMGHADAARLALGQEPEGRGAVGHEGASAGQAGSLGWIECADDKLRRVEPLIQPLAHGLPRSLGPGSTKEQRVELVAAKANRIGRLRGYGNAIDPRVAAEFIRASGVLT